MQVKNQEDKNLLREYYEGVQETYSHPETLTLQNYKEKLVKRGLVEDIAHKVWLKAMEYSETDSIKNSVLRIYPELLKRAINHPSVGR